MTVERQLPAFPVTVTTLPKAGFPARLQADEREREAIAHFCNVSSVHALDADLLVTRWRGDGVRVSGQLHATIEQPCVISLEPVVQEIDEPVDGTYLPEASPLTRPAADTVGELVLDPEGKDVPETFNGNEIDVWEVVIEALILAIDPWPKAPGAAMTAEEPAANAGNERQSPFAVLSALKKDKNR